MRIKILFAVIVILGLAAATGFAQTPKPAKTPTPTPAVSPPPSPSPAPEAEPLVSKDTPDKKLNQYRKVYGRENWDYTYDVSDLNKGTYNIIIQATDKAGNVYYSTPVNILIDPESDLPVVSFTNPVPEMRVGGSMLNIVGTCTDDDAVATVQVSIDKGDFKDAEGQDFWSYKLQTQGMDDGRHEITVQGVDVNGVVGKAVTRSFNLDTHKPLTQVTSFPSGVLLSGARDLEGTVQDLNDIASFYFSEDNGKTFTPLGTSYKREEKKYYFKLRLDTTRMPDGPQVYWFKGVDKTGSEGLAAFLFFVDNTKPELQILSPIKDEKRNGKFYVIGTVHDVIGVESLSYQYRDKTGEIKLLPGNPYWYMELDTTPYAATEETVTFTVKDTVGNVVKTPFNIAIDQNADKPVVDIAAPADKSSSGPDLDAYGFVSDDDGNESIVYTLDAKEPVTLPAKEAFSFRLTGLEPGKHVLSIYGVDVNKVKGDKKTVEFNVLGTAAVIRIQSIAVQGTAHQFFPGFEVGPFDKAVLKGTVSEYEKLKRVRWSIDGSAEKDVSLRSGLDKYTRDFDLALPDALPAGIVEVRITAVDAFDRTTEHLAAVHVTDYGSIFSKPGFYQADARLDSGTVGLTADYPYECFFVGDPVKSIDLEPKLSSVNAHAMNGRVSVIPLSDVKGETARIKIVTDNNETFYTDPITFGPGDSYFSEPLRQVKLSSVAAATGRADFYPGITISSPDGRTKIEGACNSAATRVEVSFDNKNYRGADYRRANDKPSSVFSFDVPRELPYGYNEIFLRLSGDKQSQAPYRSFFFKIDPSQKHNQNDSGVYFKDARIDADGHVRLSKDAPLYGFSVGREIKSVSVKPATDLVKASYSGNFITVEASGEGQTPPVKIEVAIVNNLTFTSQAFVFATDLAPPDVRIVSPAPGDWVNKTLLLSGTASDGSGVQSLEYRIGAGGDWVKLSPKSPPPKTDRRGKPTKTDEPADNSFSQTIDLSGTADGNVTVFLRAADASGNLTSVPLAVKKDTTAPSLAIITPEAGAKVNGLFTVTGATADAGRTTKVEFSSDGKTYLPVEGVNYFAYNLDLTQFQKMPDKFYFRATDAANNSSVVNPQFEIDTATDKPRVEIQVPAKGEVLRNDFTVSGMAFDDDGIKSISYRLDGKEWVQMGGGSSFSVPIQLVNISDNEHKIEVQAEDLNGLKGDIAASTFFVSKEEPIAVLTAPAIETTTRGAIALTGTASDANGLASVAISFDNGNTWQNASGADKWNYTFDTALLADGVHRLLVMAVDKTGTEGLSATLLHVDNTLPTLSLDRPAEGETVTDTLVLDGRAFDNIVLQRLVANVAPVNQSKPDNAGVEYALPSGSTGGVFVKSVDMSKLKEGWYNIRIEAADKANNVSYVTRNVKVEQKKITNRVDVIFPQDGDSLAGPFTVSGQVVSELEVKGATLSVDGQDGTPLELNASGYYRLPFDPEKLSAGDHVLSVSASLADGSVINSEKTHLRYAAKGPWVNITSLSTGDFITKRPWLQGQAGYYLAPAAREDKEAFAAYEKETWANRIEKVEISMDNGKTFTAAGGQTSWSYRLQTQDIPDGIVRLMVRATAASGATAITKAIVVNDDLSPMVKILRPEEGQRFNDRIAVLGVASDENGLTDVHINLRPGDKAGYKIPDFIQGMYLDFQGRTVFTGTFSWQAGFGLTFFDQNVKLQALVGMEPESRFDGLVLGVKLLANIFKLPFEALFGPDWEFFSMSLALGATFAYFTNSGTTIEFTDDGRVLGAALAQFEFAKFSVKEWSAFNAYSLYVEFDLWFLSTDVPGAPVLDPKIMFGLRIGLF
ncbi:MAG: hypothetical protein JXD23_16180 [Spirochaetales bacterium]|nr:hypothetical protein [Spirochaetales bacterium]